MEWKKEQTRKKMIVAVRCWLVLISSYSYLPGYEEQEVHTNHHHDLHSQNVSNEELAGVKYQEAADLLKAGQAINDVLPLLRSACRLHPSNATLWNDLGVAELRLGHHAKARLHFQVAAEKDASHPEAAKNLALMRRHYPGESSYRNAQDLRPTNHMEVRIEHQVRNMTRVAVEDLAWRFFTISSSV